MPPAAGYYAPPALPGAHYQPAPPQGGYYPTSAPPPGYYAVPVTAARRGRGVGTWILIVVLVVIVVGAVGGALGLATGAISTKSLLNLIGQGSASVTVENLRDDAVSPVLVDNKTGEAVLGSRQGDLASFDAGTVIAAQGGTFVLRIRGAAGDTLTECTLTIRSGDRYLFVVLPDTVMLRRNDEEPTNADELFADRSSLCR